MTLFFKSDIDDQVEDFEHQIAIISGNTNDPTPSYVIELMEEMVDLIKELAKEI